MLQESCKELASPQRRYMMTTKPISIDDHVLRCAVHGGIMQIEEHHAVNRSQGGDGGSTIYICSECHRKFTEEWWFLEWDETGFYVWEQGTGVCVMRRFIDPSFDQSLYLHNLERMKGLMDSAYPNIPLLDDDGLLDAAATAKSWGKAKQNYQMALIVEAHLRTPYGHKVELLRDLAGKMGVGLTTVQNLLKIGQTWEMQRLEMLDELPIKPLLLASGTPDPETTLDRIIDLKVTGMGSENIYRTLKGENPDAWQPCPCCNKPGDPKTFKWRAPCADTTG